ncbi:MAG: hypothetical protein ACI81P_001279 [Neolewinella sp.]|jgi:hypothetical protein
MRIDQLPIPLLIFATCLYFVAMGGFGLLAKNYRMSVPQATGVTLTDFGHGDSRNVTLYSTVPLPTEMEELTFKYFAQGIPQYIHLEAAPQQAERGNTIDVAITGAIPVMASDSIHGFVHLMKPIEQPLLSFLLN